jgi:hypothetical protein
MNFLQCASRLNNQGVYYLQQDHFSIASEFFQAAWTSLLNRMSCVPPSRGASQNMETNTTAGSIHSVPPLQLARGVSEERLDTGYFIYTCGMLLDEYFATGDLELTSALFTCGVLFNFALIHHKQGLLGQDSRLKASLVLYYDCAILLEKARTVKDFSPPNLYSSCCQLQTVLFNNMAHIHLHHCNYGTFQSCLRSVEIVISQGRSLLQHEVNFPIRQLVMNLLVMTEYPMACAA